MPTEGGTITNTALPSEKVNRQISILIIAIAAALLSACGKKDHFEVRGRIDGLGTATVTLTYYDNGLKRLTTLSENDLFRLKGETAIPTMAFLDMAGNSRRVVLVVENGKKITVEAPENEPVKVKGSSPSSKIAEWMADNREAISTGDERAINTSIARFVGDNKGNLASPALMAAYFRFRGHEKDADSLFALMKPEVRTPALTHNFNSIMAAQLAAAAEREFASFTLYDRSDSVITFSVRRKSFSLIAVVGTDRQQRDSIIPAIRPLSETPKAKKVGILEISTAPDTTEWHASVRNDSAAWRQTWEPAALSSQALRRLAIPSVPFFVVTDSTGTQIYRGPSVSSAVSTIENNIANR